MSKKSRAQKQLESILKLRMRIGLVIVDQMLQIDESDYRSIDPEEIQSRISKRLAEQDEIIFPQRERELQLTSEWRDYSARRRL